MQQKFNVIKLRHGNATIIYRVRKSDTIVKGEIKLGEIYAESLYQASLFLEQGLDLNARGIFSTSGRIEV